MSKKCETEYFYDDNVKSCQPCKDICSPPEMQEGICEKKCKEFLETSSPTSLNKNEDDEKNITMINVLIIVSLFCTIIIIIITVFLCKDFRKKLKPRVEQQTQEMLQRENIAPNLQRSSDLCTTPTHQLQSSSPRDANMRPISLEWLTSHRTVENEYSHFLADLVIDSPVDHQPDAPRREDSFLTNKSSELNFIEDQPYQTSCLGESLCSSYEEPYYFSSDGIKPYFQVLMDSFSSYPFFRSAWITGSSVNIGLSAQNFEFNKSVVDGQLKLLSSDYSENVKKTTVVIA